ncbi:MAG: RES family NAD+ phosphorylase [Chlorobi bacterium]|nr:RES family NAD+ phosphorylase [Chlorobiota bacterium]
MLVFRLARKKYPVVLSGKGSARSGNRWNSKGTEIIYCAGNRALAMAEVAVHLTIATLPGDFVMMEIFIPDNVSIEPLNVEDLPDGWNRFPHLISTQITGDDFVRSNRACILQVPSAVVKGDYNYLINPYHPDFIKIIIQNIFDFPFDNRIFG